MGLRVGEADDLDCQIDDIGAQAGGVAPGDGIRRLTFDKTAQPPLQIARAAQHQADWNLDASVDVADGPLQVDDRFEVVLRPGGEHREHPALHGVAEPVLDLFVGQEYRGVGIGQHLLVEMGGQILVALLGDAMQDRGCLGRELI